MKNSYYDASVRQFLSDDPAFVLGHLAEAHSFALEGLQKGAWIEQIRHLQCELAGLGEGHIFFEFSIPRMGKRADVVILFRGHVLVLEYKVGESDFPGGAIDQVVDYCLDLKNFHLGSHELPVIPVLICTRADRVDRGVEYSEDLVAHTICLGASGLRTLLGDLPDGRWRADVNEWMQSGYMPTPTIIEAAEALYQGHEVEEISRSDGGAINLSKTEDAIARQIERAKAESRKVVCFVTGVPGAGKTLAGLNLATSRHRDHEEEHAVFLSGNGPLVDVLREALARDDCSRALAHGKKKPKTQARRETNAFIQNIHHFRDEGLLTDKAPVERVVVFDEAQRAWTREKATDFMRRKRGQANFDMSEPEFLLSLMDRHEGWCVVVCLIGGGQEINTGEAGLPEWYAALNRRFHHWAVACPTAIAERLDGDEVLKDPVVEPDLHLGVSIRSFRAEATSDFVDKLLKGDAAGARSLQSALDSYPFVMTRDLKRARRWLADQSRGTERTGLVASSKSYRLRPDGVNMKAQVKATDWFLGDKRDVRSSFALEEAASEFDIQGLELDWICVCWDANLRREDGAWATWRFHGAEWQRIKSLDRVRYLINAYRVLLTRARQGVVIFVPRGDAEDHTRPPEVYDAIVEFLVSAGVQQLSD